MPSERAPQLESKPNLTGNMPELTVSELAGALKRTVEERFGLVRVRGEIGSWRGPAASGHAYFSLKDEGARLDAVIWKSALARLKTKPEEGLQVIATGRLTTFPGKSSYQIIIEALEPAGVGALMALLDERRRRLAAEGLFDSARKRAPPFLPRVIGVVTSPTGAVIRDILHRLRERFPRRVLVWPARVQGESCAAEVAAGIEGFNALAPEGAIPRPDVLIVARGGGSFEDLWGFNEEIVARAAAASAIPLISAIGHETDTTLIDLAADLRAPTPTAAAEKAAPVRAELVEQIAVLARRLQAAQRRLLDDRRARLTALERHLASPDRALATPRQRRDLVQQKLAAAMRAGLDARRLRLARASGLLARHSPQAEFARACERLRGLSARLAQAMRARLALEAERVAFSRRRAAQAGERLLRAFRHGLEARRGALARIDALSRSLGPEAALQRGFVLARDKSGQIVRSAHALTLGDQLSLTFSDGVALVRVLGGEVSESTRKEEAAPARRRPSGRVANKDQGQLF
ncbi:exodeoxyribonuclease VII large subunit [Methylocystis bryophila]|uniref:Exodeoxyribonuclease 7 large subunit n=1 Tax=Methylocystis bryophila TaxID=655015 RepID=A0A1W6MZA1_9HYPH|nr:exodeoxyribonuclease VII large subunit [Methylocystis bryophila]ARN82866.1 exodeoxyribonuclease VII large subunit [Methylocystis bryophila]BDV39134.1 exodeoxyribonuclease 7 large subunit [Methylocystis bryophila]